MNLEKSQHIASTKRKMVANQCSQLNNTPRPPCRFLKCQHEITVIKGQYSTFVGGWTCNVALCADCGYA